MSTLRFLKCSLPTCDRTVGQHSSKKNNNKSVCDQHRTSRKSAVDKWKMENGCSNKDGLRYGFPCVSKTILHPATLDINHVDGNNLNRDPSNVEILCKMCHTMVTLNHKHHLIHNKSRRAKFTDTGLFTGLF